MPTTVAGERKSRKQKDCVIKYGYSLECDRESVYVLFFFFFVVVIHFLVGSVFDLHTLDVIPSIGFPGKWQNIFKVFGVSLSLGGIITRLMQTARKLHV